MAATAAIDPASTEALQADHRFHSLIAEATGNAVIASVVDTLWTLRERSLLSAHIFAEARREEINPRVEDHRLIVDALRARDPHRARNGMRDHLRRVVEDLLAATEVKEMARTRSRIGARRNEIARRISA